MVVDLLILFPVFLLLIAGLVGCVLPVLPGPVLCYAGLVLVQFTAWGSTSTQSLLVLGGLSVGVQILDNLVPIWGTRKLGGTKAGLWGSTIGLVIAVFILPLLGIALGPFGLFGIILGPLVGAFVGEKIGGTPDDQALRAAFGSFVGFVAGTLLKGVVSIILCLWVGFELFQGRAPL